MMKRFIGRPAGLRVRKSAPVRIAIAGCGRWGINHIRVFQQLEGCRIVGCCDPDPRTLRRFGPLAGTAAVFDDSFHMLRVTRPDALVVVTPASTHYQVVAGALRAGVHVLVEKPLALTSREAKALVDLAAQHRRILMVGHIFHYHRALTKLHGMIRSGKLGSLRYLYSGRTNLGPIRDDVNVLWDLAPHDVSMMMYLTGDVPSEVSANGQSYLRRNTADVVFGTLYFRNKRVIGHLHVSWLDPHKVRKLTVIGSKKMAVFDDVSTQEPLRLYDRGVIKDKIYGDFGQFQLMLRDGDIHVPHVAVDEPLRAECSHFVECVRRQRTPLTDGLHGLRVVRVLEALSRSLRAKGHPVKVL